MKMSTKLENAVEQAVAIGNDATIKMGRYEVRFTVEPRRTHTLYFVNVKRYRLGGGFEAISFSTVDKGRVMYCLKKHLAGEPIDLPPIIIEI